MRRLAGILFVAIALLGEQLQLFHAAGYALVLAGITLATRR